MDPSQWTCRNEPVESGDTLVELLDSVMDRDVPGAEHVHEFRLPHIGEARGLTECQALFPEEMNGELERKLPFSESAGADESSGSSTTMREDLLGDSTDSPTCP